MTSLVLDPGCAIVGDGLGKGHSVEEKKSKGCVGSLRFVLILSVPSSPAMDHQHLHPLCFSSSKEYRL